MKPLNNKGYMLVEIILAFSIAMVLAYFMTDLTIKLKNKNDDLLVKTLVTTDQAIIYNTIMRDLYNDASGFDCSLINISGNSFTYDRFTNIISDYANFGTVSCSNDASGISIGIEINVSQLPEENFDVNIDFEKS